MSAEVWLLGCSPPTSGMAPSAAATDSSPTRQCVGNDFSSSSKMMSSHFLSVAVTRSQSPLYQGLYTLVHLTAQLEHLRDTSTGKLRVWRTQTAPYERTWDRV